VSTPGTMRIAIGVATVGRAAVLARTLETFGRQIRPADAIFVCGTVPSDVAGVSAANPDVRILFGPKGSSHQRNAILKAASAFDALVFFDDDFLPCPHYLAEIERTLARHPDVVVATGEVLADGILGPGLAFEEADRLLSTSPDALAEQPEIVDVYNAYGCNMIVRLSAVRAAGAAFDEQLPLYAWLEDVDLSRQLAPYGRIVKTRAARGVHLGVKSGRQSGVRLGYSQIANPVYLIRKGTCTVRKGVHQLTRNILANVAKSFAPEPHVDRRGRAIGNFYALLDLARGRVTPSRAQEL
jgi:GT2 family glycosyltransferase